MADVMKTLGASNHSKSKREENDYYATPKSATLELLKREKFYPTIIEPAVGGGHIAKVLENNGYQVQGYDIIDRGYKNTIIKDFMTVNIEKKKKRFDIVTNPPYGITEDFVSYCLNMVPVGTKTAMLLPIRFLEGQKRYKIINSINPPKSCHVFVKRIYCYKNGIQTDDSSAVCYGWFIWEKGYTGKTEVDWIPPER